MQKIKQETKGQQNVNLVIPVLIILIVGSLAIIIYYASLSLESNNTPVNTEGEELPELTEEETLEKISACDSGISDHQKDWCYLDLAKKYRIDSCQKIIQDDFKKYCKALVNKDSSECENIISTSARDACYISMAIILNDKKLCEKSARQEFCESSLP